MGSMADACKNVLNCFRGAVACGVIDLDQKKVLEVRILPQFSTKKAVAMTDVIINLFQGTCARQLAQILKTQASESNNDVREDFKEIQMTFKQHIYFAKPIKNGSVVIFLVTKKTINIGMAWVRLRSIIPVVGRLIL